MADKAGALQIFLFAQIIKVEISSKVFLTRACFGTVAVSAG